MCGGGTGSANDSSNDNESGSGNSFKETLANIFTPNDGMSYVDGQLRESSSGNRVSIPASSNNDRGGSSAPAPSMRQSRVSAGIMGALTGGIPGLIGGLAVNELSGGKTGRSYLDVANKAKSGLGGLFDAPDEAASEGPMRPRMRPANFGAPAVDPFDSGPSQPAPVAPAATVGLPEPTLTMSEQAAVGAFQAIPNPNYDPTDPLSPRFLSNPTYDQLLAFRDSGKVPGMAEGGEVMGGNEKTAIADAVSAVKGEMSEEQSALVLGKFLANYGEEALRDLVEKVQSGELDDTVERFAKGEAGEVNGPGDGSGVDDKVPASLEGQQDVLLADGEFVLRKKTADALEKKYGGGFLDAVNEAENDAPRTMQQYMARN